MQQTQLPGGFERTEADNHIAEDVTQQLSAKQEGKLIHFVDQRLLDVSRLYKRRAVEDSQQAVSSTALDQLLTEISSIVKILYQIPTGSAPIATAYSLNILDTVSDYLRVFDRSPETSFAFLSELDNLFVKLIRERAVNVTEQTRLNGLVARLRLIVFTKYKGHEQYESQCSDVFEFSLGLI